MLMIQFVSKHPIRPHGTTQLRCVQPANYLREKGYTVTLGGLYQTIPTAGSIIILHRALLDSYSTLFLRYARSSGCSIFYDIDDLLFEEEAASYCGVINDRPVNADGYRRAIEICDGVITSTTLLAERARHLNSNVVVIKNALSTEFFESAEQVYLSRRDDHPWVTAAYLSGSRSHDHDFAVIQPILLKLLHRFPFFRLLIVGPLQVCDSFNAFGERFKHRPLMPYNEFVRSFDDIDINLVPLVYRNKFCQAKSELKYIEAGACGVPSVASPTEVYKQAIQSYKNGILADDEAWYNALKELIENRQLRRTLGDAARRHVIANYSPDVRTEEWVAWLKDVEASRFATATVDCGIQRKIMRLQLEWLRAARFMRRVSTGAARRVGHLSRISGM